MPSLNRRDVLKLSALLVDVLSPARGIAAVPKKRIIVAGAGLAGLTCAWELTRRGHETIVLEASGRVGGHVRTVREGLADGLYADAGAEHFTKPGYELFHRYVKEFDLPVLPYPHRENVLQVVDGRMIPESEAQSARVLQARGFNQREVAYLTSHPDGDLSDLYFGRYMEKITDEYQPFGVGLDSLDAQTVTGLLRQDGASSAAIESIGSDDSALHGIWRQAILRLRGVPSNPRELFRLKGGNQMLPDAFAIRLGNRIRKNCAVTDIRHVESGVVVVCRENGEEKKFDADYLVCCMSAIMLRVIAVTPAWPDNKQYAIANMPYTVETRPIFQSRTKFWKRDGYSGNMEFGSPLLGPLWPMAQDVPTGRGLLIGTAQGGVSASMAYGVFKRYYPGKSVDIDNVMAVDWQLDKWAMACQARDYRPGELKKFWPASIQPIGRVYFAGAYCDNMNWGMEAATRSAYRVARAIDEA
ncbi:MAG TPA: FAD-dependent oxidoreductase [Bryobacteraceae bacterium]|jgi:monoamine oxidase|nr:FAD-dependent oxidoreductase [Bryobacteraceae bacterium]